MNKSFFASFFSKKEESFFFFFEKKKQKTFICSLAVMLALATRNPVLAQRVVSLNLCSDQLLVLLAPEQVTGLEPLARDPALSFVAARAAKLPQVRNDAEAIIALKPDLVLAGDYGAQTTVALLQERGIRVARLDEPHNFDGIAVQVMQVAALLNVPARGRLLVADMWQRLHAVHMRHGRAIFLEAGGWSAGPDGFGGSVVAAAGFQNGGTGGQIGIESLVARPPDLLITSAAPAFPSLATDFLWHPALAGIRRKTLDPAWTICAGPYSVAAVESLVQ